MNNPNHTADLGKLLDRHLFKAVTFDFEVVEEIQSLLGESLPHLAESGVVVRQITVDNTPYLASVGTQWGTNEQLLFCYRAETKSIDVFYGITTPSQEPKGTHVEVIEEYRDIPSADLHEVLKKHSKKDIRPPSKEHATA